MRSIYLDNAAATPISASAQQAMREAATLVGNPSSLHQDGRRAGQVLAQARQTTATFLNARPEQIIFTASGSEANTMAVLRLAEANPKYKHVVTTPIEHKSILEAVQVLKKKGYRVTLVPVDRKGMIDPDDVIDAIRDDTLLVSVMYVNNEIGTIEPVSVIGRELRRLRRKAGRSFPLLHSDSCQAAGYLPMDVHRSEVDLLTFNGSKVYGPRGVGVLFVRSEISLTPQVFGGAHERGLRAGTENVPAIVGFAAALKDINPSDGERIAKLRDHVIERLGEVVEDIHVNGPSGSERFANNVNISVKGAAGEQLVLELDRHGISVGTGAACTAHETGPSHVLKAIKVPKEYIHCAIRVSLGKKTTKRELNRFLEVLPGVVETVRRRNLRRV